ncbi:FAD-dependent oxidoreductase [Arthrobacter gandavensis]|uniref:oxidoreductase n=1 Tax=Arthrobacter gandavensis TaxID=169960 RepID=UPI00188F1F07|nr:FAD-dependent oxidoreductase [Arthrobacter gandavensis]MBF4993895.1 FAD-dependent oxidoreductase [Arthrobacter gandavensis]
MSSDPRPGVRQYPHAFAAGSIGSMALPHRIIMGSMHLNFEADAGALAAFYAERAAGGAGLIVTGGAAVNRAGSGGPTYLVCGEQPYLLAAQAVLSAVHDAGGRVALQLFHAGRYAFPGTYGLLPLAPSALWSGFARTVPQAMDETQIRTTLRDFAAAAAQARELGFDAVEIMGSEGYLVNQFASPAANHRDDAWGGDAVRRRAFPLAVLDAVRGAAGEDFPVIFRMSGADLVEGSAAPPEYAALAEALAARGAAALAIGIGWHESRTPTVQSLVPHGSWLGVAARIRVHLRSLGHQVPVIGSNRVNSVAQANAALASGSVDYVSMARAFLADPRIVAKAEAGREDLVNTCIGCNEACIDRSLGTDPVSCLVNPRTGRETEFPARVRPARSTRMPVAVVGAGPAGMQAAATLAAAGTRVHLFEAEPGIGGQFRLAQTVPGKSDFAQTIRYFTNELPRLGVRIHTGVTAAAADLDGFAHVVDASGVLPRTVDLRGGGVPVLDYRTAFENPAALPGRLAVIGGGGIAVDLAHLLVQPAGTAFPLPESEADARARFHREHLDPRRRPPDRRITVLRRGPSIGHGIGASTRWAALQALRNAGVDLRTGITYRELVPGGLLVEGPDGEAEVVLADAVVIAAGQIENTGLQLDLAGAGIPCTVIGGAASAAGLNAVRAFREGLEAGSAVAASLAGVTPDGNDRERRRAPLP